jgi:hypothetical protein
MYDPEAHSDSFMMRESFLMQDYIPVKIYDWVVQYLLMTPTTWIQHLSNTASSSRTLARA